MLESVKIAVAVAKQERDLMESMELMVTIGLQPGGRDFILKLTHEIGRRLRDSYHTAHDELGDNSEYSKEFENANLQEALIARLAQIGFNAISTGLGEKLLRRRLEKEQLEAGDE